MYDELIKTLEHWDYLIGVNEEKFLQKFASKDAWILNNVSWDCENMRYTYIVESGMHVGDSAKIKDWLEFLKTIEK